MVPIAWGPIDRELLDKNSGMDGWDCEFRSQCHILRLLRSLLCKLRNFVVLWGAKVQGNGYLRIQGRMQIFEKMSQKALNLYLTLPV